MNALKTTLTIASDTNDTSLSTQASDQTAHQEPGIYQQMLGGYMTCCARQASGIAELNCRTGMLLQSWATFSGLMGFIFARYIGGGPRSYLVEGSAEKMAFGESERVKRIKKVLE